jgi:hypothetical protein
MPARINAISGAARGLNHMSTDNPNPIDVPSKPLKGKYDKRCKSPKSIAARDGAARSTKQLGRKPNWMKHLSRNKAWEILKELDDIASLKEIYAYCWQKGKVELMLGAREYLWNRAEGRPFVAENPEKVTKADALYQDSRLQEAIKQLVPKPSVKSVM